MTPQLINIVQVPMPPVLPSLKPPLIEPQAMEMEIASVFSFIGVPHSGKIPDLVPLVGELSLMSSEWNAPYYDHILFNHVEHYRDAGRVLERLSAERDFFRGLYAPAGGFSIRPVDGYAFDYDGSVFPTIVFESGKRVYGCADFTSWPKAIVLEYIQGVTSSTSSEQIDAFGGRWFEAFMDRAVEAYSAISGHGIGLMLKLDENRYRLPRMVRDRYFERRPTEVGDFLPLSMQKLRVRKIIGACAGFSALQSDQAAPSRPPPGPLSRNRGSRAWSAAVLPKRPI